MEGKKTSVAKKSYTVWNRREPNAVNEFENIYDPTSGVELMLPPRITLDEILNEKNVRKECIEMIYCYTCEQMKNYKSFKKNPFFRNCAAVCNNKHNNYYNSTNKSNEQGKNNSAKEKGSSSKQVSGNSNKIIPSSNEKNSTTNGKTRNLPMLKHDDRIVDKDASLLRKKCRKKPRKKNNKSFRIDQKEEFEDYYDEARIEEGIKKGTMDEGVVKMIKRNPKDAFVTISSGRDVYIKGKKYRNRALLGDQVVIEFAPDDSSNSADKDKNVQQRRGKVVFIKEKVHSRVLTGYVNLDEKQGFILYPQDTRLPFVRIANYTDFSVASSRGASSSMANDSSDMIDPTMLYSAEILEWFHTGYAEGIILEKLGRDTDVNTVTAAILLENNLSVEPLPDAHLYFPQEIPYAISEEEIRKRKDFRNYCVFSIDPAGARDLDDALSCKLLPDGNVEIGVHISDVTHFLESGTALDADVCRKATSVYFTHTVYHMLPVKLCEMCSLLPNEDKLTFSCVVIMSPEAEILSHKFVKSVVKSCGQLTYNHAQAVIDRGSFDADNMPKVGNGFTADDCRKAIVRLHNLAMIMRKKRFEGGALQIDQPKLSFTLDEDLYPISYKLYETKTGNWLVEEYMLMANTLTARKLKETFPDLALLRNHVGFIEEALEEAVDVLGKLGINIGKETAGDVFKSLIQYEGDEDKGTVIKHLLVKPMMRALYLCGGCVEDDDELSHYALNVPLYTHFTSPIRRYADIMVHRALAAALNDDSGQNISENWTKESVEKIAQICNAKKYAAKMASDSSVEFFWKLYVMKNGPLVMRAVATDVRKSYLEVIVKDIRMAYRVVLTTGKTSGNKSEGDLEDSSYEYENNDGVGTLFVTWPRNGENGKDEETRQEICVFTTLMVRLSYDEILKVVRATLTRPD